MNGVGLCVEYIHGIWIDLRYERLLQIVYRDCRDKTELSS